MQTKLQEWVKTKQLISREAAEWNEQKETLTDLNSIRQLETGQLADLIASAGERIDEVSAQRAAFEKEEADLKTWRRELEVRINRLENEIRPLLGGLPVPLRAGIEAAVTQLEENDPDRPLQHRTRDLLQIMQACLAFHETLTVDTEIREVGGQEREVDVLYLGLTRAWYVDRSGQFSGSGSAAPGGWVWSEDNSLAARVRRAIDIQNRLEAPGFVELPILNGTPVE